MGRVPEARSAQHSDALHGVVAHEFVSMAGWLPNHKARLSHCIHSPRSLLSPTATARHLDAACIRIASSLGTLLASAMTPPTPQYESHHGRPSAACTQHVNSTHLRGRHHSNSVELFDSIETPPCSSAFRIAFIFLTVYVVVPGKLLAFASPRSAVFGLKET
jgi:hypothetical protein